MPIRPDPPDHVTLSLSGSEIRIGLSPTLSLEGHCFMILHAIVLIHLEVHQATIIMIQCPGARPQN